MLRGVSQPVRRAGDAPGRVLGALSLFTAASTLLCCALPTLLVFLGFGAAVASVVASVPVLVTLSRQKAWMFAVAGMLIAAAFAYRRWLAPGFLARQLACAPDDPRCRALDRLSGALLWIATGFYVVGAAVAYGLPQVLAWLEA